MILFVDNEPHRVVDWVDALTDEFGEGSVVFMDNAPEALGFIRSEECVPVDLLICDMMMPTGGDIDNEEAEYGTRTGVVVIREFRELFPDKPVIVLTNVRDDALMARYNQDNCRAGQKRDVLPLPLVKWVQEMLEPDGAES